MRDRYRLSAVHPTISSRAYVDQKRSEPCMHQEAITRAVIRNINI